MKIFLRKSYSTEILKRYGLLKFFILNWWRVSWGYQFGNVLAIWARTVSNSNLSTSFLRIPSKVCDKRFACQYQSETIKLFTLIQLSAMWQEIQQMCCSHQSYSNGRPFCNVEYRWAAHSVTRSLLKYSLWRLIKESTLIKKTF